MRSSRGDTEACCGNPGAPHGWRSVWATRETPGGLPVMSHSSLPMADRHGLSPRRRTCQQECLQTEGRRKNFKRQSSCWMFHHRSHDQDVTWSSSYLNCLCLPGSVERRNLHPKWWAEPRAPPASRTPEGPAELWRGCSEDAWRRKRRSWENSEWSRLWLKTSTWLFLLIPSMIEHFSDPALFLTCFPSVSLKKLLLFGKTRRRSTSFSLPLTHFTVTSFVLLTDLYVWSRAAWYDLKPMSRWILIHINVKFHPLMHEMTSVWWLN